jgi:hypothetical protein
MIKPCGLVYVLRTLVHVPFGLAVLCPVAFVAAASFSLRDTPLRRLGPAWHAAASSRLGPIPSSARSFALSAP